MKGEGNVVPNSAKRGFNMVYNNIFSNMISRCVSVLVKDVPSNYISNLKNFVLEDSKAGIPLVSKIFIEPTNYTFGGFEYVRGEIFTQEVEVYSDWEYKPSENKLIKEQKNRRISHVCHFWLSPDKKILLIDRSDMSFITQKLLSSAIFGEEGLILPIEFDVRQIDSQCCKGIYKLWRYNFKDRNGDIDKGTHYSKSGEAVSDPMYQETINASKNSVGIELTVNNEITRILVIENGVIVIHKSWLEETDLDNIFQVVEEIMKYRVIPHQTILSSR